MVVTESEVEVSKEEIRQFQKLKLITRIRELMDQRSLFEQRFKMGLTEFQQTLRAQNEDFELFDISLEWKAMFTEIEELEKLLSEVEHAKSFRITD